MDIAKKNNSWMDNHEYVVLKLLRRAAAYHVRPMPTHSAILPQALPLGSSTGMHVVRDACGAPSLPSSLSLWEVPASHYCFFKCGNHACDQV